MAEKRYAKLFVGPFGWLRRFNFLVSQGKSEKINQVFYEYGFYFRSRVARNFSKFCIQ